MTKLVITIDLEKHGVPTREKLLEAGYARMSDYLIDFVYLNPPRILDKAIWEITDSILDVNKLTEVRLSVLGTLASYYGEELTGGLIEKITGEVMKDISEYVTGTQTVP